MTAKKGLIMVYTGNGKGKTTAAFGLALRAVGHGKRVFMIQFMKGSEKYGEIQAVKKYLPGFELVQKGRDTFVGKGHPQPEDLKLAQEGVELAIDVVLGGRHDIIILDEINVAVEFGLIPVEEVLRILDLKPPHVTLVLTGRYAPEKVLERADMVSEVREVKHHFHKGIHAQPGIEF